MHMVLHMIFHLKYILEDVSCQCTDSLLVFIHTSSSRQMYHNSFKPFAFDGILGGLILWLLQTMLQQQKTLVFMSFCIYTATYVD